MRNKTITPAACLSCFLMVGPPGRRKHFFNCRCSRTDLILSQLLILQLIYTSHQLVCMSQSLVHAGGFPLLSDDKWILRPWVRISWHRGSSGVFTGAVGQRRWSQTVWEREPGRVSYLFLSDANTSEILRLLKKLNAFKNMLIVCNWLCVLSLLCFVQVNCHSRGSPAWCWITTAQKNVQEATTIYRPASAFSVGKPW